VFSNLFFITLPKSKNNSLSQNLLLKKITFQQTNEVFNIKNNCKDIPHVKPKQDKKSKGKYF